jgi:hypothetical protein
LWRDEVESSKFRVDPAKHWSPPNQPIKFKDKAFTKASAIAKYLCKLFTSAAHHKSDQQTRKVERSLRLKHKLDPTYSNFTPLQTRDAINESKCSSAIGPDGLTAIHLRHLGPRGLAYLTGLFNMSVNKADLPAIWKAAVIVPILKPGKPAGDGSSYRPFSLLCPAVKVLEKLLLPQVTANLLCFTPAPWPFCQLLLR